MNSRGFRWWWILPLVALCAGVYRLHFSAEVLDLLPPEVPSVAGIKLYQQHFTNNRELIIAVHAPDSATAESAAKAVAARLRLETNFIADAIWQPPWLEHPEQTAELIADLWLNQPPEDFRKLAQRLEATNLPGVLATTREQLSTSLSPMEMAQLSYDPFGLTRLPERVAGLAPRMGPDQNFFVSPDGTFRILFVQSREELAGYRECTEWLEQIKHASDSALAGAEFRGATLGYTGRPAFVAEIASSMRRDMILSIGGTSLIIACLFWFAHRRWKPMLWLLILLALILAGTLALGGLIFGAINVVSMGFAAILLGLAVDYAVVHFQEALAHPDLSVPEIRRSIAPSIFWAATTTITAFLTLNFGGLPGLAQLGSLVGIGVALSACVMIYAFLPPLFPDRREPRAAPSPVPSFPAASPASPARVQIVFILTAMIVLVCGIILFRGLPGMDATAKALQPRESQAFATLDAIKANLNQKREPLWLVVSGHDEQEVAGKLDAIEPILNRAVTNHLLSGFNMPTVLWPRPDAQANNRLTAQLLVDRAGTLHAAALDGGFSEEALGLTRGILDVWKRAAASTNVYWPTNPLCSWIMDKFASHAPGQYYAAGFIYPPANMDSTASMSDLARQLPTDGVWLSGWELLGGEVLQVVKHNLWKLVLPMVLLVLLSLGLAFRRPTEILLSLAILLLSGLCLLAVMKIMGWSWNLLDLMALPLILGTGVDYSIFMQLALRRYHGNLEIAHKAVGRALLLCGATAVSGFGSLALSSNAGMSSLGQVCAVGIAGNMLISVYLLPVWWQRLVGGKPEATQSPSAFYQARVWKLGLTLVRLLPESFCTLLARLTGTLYCKLASHRREIVRENLLPAYNGDSRAVEKATQRLFQEFALKIAELWRYESGAPMDGSLTEWCGWERIASALARGRGILLVTPHLGNWELGGPFMIQRGCKLLVLTQAEPDAQLTRLRQESRARQGVETLVVGEDAFAFVEIIKQLQAGANVALLIDRPPQPTAVTVELFGQPFQASIAAAELARASGCAILPVYIVRVAGGYRAEVLPEIIYDRTAIGDRAARIRLTQEIMRAFEPLIRQYADQWYHFVPIWAQKFKK